MPESAMFHGVAIVHRSFQVLGLPRSGTAFLSALFNLNPNAICLHEPAADPELVQPRIEELKKKIRYVGICDTMAGRYEGTRLAGAKTVYIARDPDASWRAIQAALGVNVEWSAFLEVLDANISWAIDTNALLVSYDDLFNVATLEVIWDHVFGYPDSPFPVEKVNQLVRMNVQRHNPAQAFLPTPEILKNIV